MSNFDAQLKFAGKLAKKRKINAKQLPMQTKVDVSMSSEMEAWLSSTLESSEEGYLDEVVGGPLAKPLDSMSLYTPLANIVASQYAAVKPLESTNERENRQLKERKSRRLGNSTSTFDPNNNNNNTSMSMSISEYGESYPEQKSYMMDMGLDEYGTEEISRVERVDDDDEYGGIGGMSTMMESGSYNTGKNTTNQSIDETSTTSYSTTWSMQKAVENRPKPMLVNDAMKRLEVLWMKRRAQIEMDEGDHKKAMETLNQALSIHIDSKTIDNTTGKPINDYINANLGSHSLKQPEGLLNYMANTYFDFDKTAHIDAGRIQRCFLRWYKRRSNRVLSVQKFFRGYQVRNKRWQYHHMRKQAVIIIQRCYRRYLAYHCYMSSRIKRWYICLKLMEQFREKIYFHRNAYRIQRLYRGYTGRVVASLKRKELDSTSLIQRQARAWRQRHPRALAIKVIHKHYYLNARVIQSAMRRVLSIKRSQIQLLNEMVREEDRYIREKGVVEEAISIQLKKVLLYMKTDTGKEHMANTKYRIRLKDRAYKKTKKNLTIEEQMTHDAMISFELFDTDGSGLIDETELAQMLEQLAIPMNKEGVKELAKEIDSDGSGDIDFGEFMDWYTRGGSQDVQDNQSFEDVMFKQVLKAKTLLLEITGIILQKRTERDMLRQATVWQSKDIAATFRNSHGPKFQCCQCMEPFVFFADYQEHFDKKGRCIVTKEKGIFFNKYYIKRDWNWQRQVEIEIRRLNDELPNINYHSVVATFHDISLQKNLGVKALTVEYIKKAQIMYMDKHANNEENNDTKTMSEEIMTVVKLCGDEHLNPLVALVIAECLNVKVPEIWIVEDEWDMDEFETWIETIVDKGIALKPPPMYTKCLNQQQEKLKQDTWLLATIYVRVVRLLQVAAESSLIAIMECRSRRPRTMTIPDDDLIEAGYDHLTRAAYLQSKKNIVDKLQIANDAFEKLMTIYSPTKCEKFLKKTSGNITVGPDGKLTEENLRKILIADAHVRAMASFKGKTNSSVGRTQIRRLACELWAQRFVYRQNGLAIGNKQGKKCSTISSQKKAGDILYLYERYASAATGDGIDMWDMELVEKALSIYIPEPQWIAVKALLDPKRTGYIAFNTLFLWLMEGQHRKFFSYTRGLYNVGEYIVWNIIDTIYWLHAENNLLTTIRKVSRLELDYRRKSVEMLMLQANLPEGDDMIIDPLTSSEEIIRREKAKAAIAAKKSNGSDDDDSDNDNDEAAIEEELDEAGKLAKQKAEENIEKDKTRILQLQFECDALNEKIVKIKNSDEEGESLLLFRLAEQEAQSECVWNFFSRRGIYNIRTEMLIMKATNVIIDAYGYCISPFARYPWTAKRIGSNLPKTSKKLIELRKDIVSRSKDCTKGNKASHDNDDHDEEEDAEEHDSDYEAGWAISLAVLVYAYDTDCSGTFDEGEVKLLLKNALAGLREREVLFKFPEVKDDAASLHTMVKYLAPRVLWGRGYLARFGFGGGAYIITKPSLNAAASMLISLSRQLARAKAEEAAELARTGHMQEEEDAKNDDALMMRAQMLAMRQVILFRRTIQGRFKYRATKKLVKSWWWECCWKTGFSRNGLLSYAFQVHREYNGLLITELPHLLRFCVVCLKFYTTSFVSEIGKMIEDVKMKSDIYWLSEEDTLLLLDKALSGTSSYFNMSRQKPQTFLRRLWCVDRDANINMNSKARQQSVLIALQFDGIYVSDTNYRCSVLGLHDVMHSITQKSSWGILRKKEKIHIKKLNWKYAPREASMFLLLSVGYEMDDLLQGNVQSKWAEVEHNEGGIAADMVNIKECFQEVKKEVNKSFASGGFIGTVTGYMQRAKRWLNYATQKTGGLVHYWNYFRVSKAIQTEGKKVNKEGAKYLREILTGQSHCVADADDDDSEK
jgi:hypothetical protein